FERLQADRRAFIAELHSESGIQRFWVAAERAEMFAALHPNAEIRLDASLSANTMDDGDGDGANPVSTTANFADAVLATVQGWMTHLGPTTSVELGGLLALSAHEIEKALLRMEASGTILRGKFRPQGLKPQNSFALNGTAEAVPSHTPSGGEKERFVR